MTNVDSFSGPEDQSRQGEEPVTSVVIRKEQIERWMEEALRATCKNATDYLLPRGGIQAFVDEVIEEEKIMLTDLINKYCPLEAKSCEDLSILQNQLDGYFSLYSNEGHENERKILEIEQAEYRKIVTRIQQILAGTPTELVLSEDQKPESASSEVKIPSTNKVSKNEVSEHGSSEDAKNFFEFEDMKTQYIEATEDLLARIEAAIEPEGLSPKMQMETQRLFVNLSKALKSLRWIEVADLRKASYEIVNPPKGKLHALVLPRDLPASLDLKGMVGDVRVNDRAFVIKRVRIPKEWMKAVLAGVLLEHFHSINQYSKNARSEATIDSVNARALAILTMAGSIPLHDWLKMNSLEEARKIKQAIQECSPKIVAMIRFINEKTNTGEPQSLDEATERVRNIISFVTWNSPGENNDAVSILVDNEICEKIAQRWLQEGKEAQKTSPSIDQKKGEFMTFEETIHLYTKDLQQFAEQLRAAPTMPNPLLEKAKLSLLDIFDEWSTRFSWVYCKDLKTFVPPPELEKVLHMVVINSEIIKSLRQGSTFGTMPSCPHAITVIPLQQNKKWAHIGLAEALAFRKMNLGEDIRPDEAALYARLAAAEVHSNSRLLRFAKIQIDQAGIRNHNDLFKFFRGDPAKMLQYVKILDEYIDEEGPLCFEEARLRTSIYMAAWAQSFSPDLSANVPDHMYKEMLKEFANYWMIQVAQERQKKRDVSDQEIIPSLLSQQEEREGSNEISKTELSAIEDAVAEKNELEFLSFKDTIELYERAIETFKIACSTNMKLMPDKQQIIERARDEIVGMTEKFYWLEMNSDGMSRDIGKKDPCITVMYPKNPDWPAQPGLLFPAAINKHTLLIKPVHLPWQTAMSVLIRGLYQANDEIGTSLKYSLGSLQWLVGLVSGRTEFTKILEETMRKEKINATPDVNVFLISHQEKFLRFLLQINKRVWIDPPGSVDEAIARAEMITDCLFAAARGKNPHSPKAPPIAYNIHIDLGKKWMQRIAANSDTAAEATAKKVTPEDSQRKSKISKVELFAIQDSVTKGNCAVLNLSSEKIDIQTAKILKAAELLYHRIQNRLRDDLPDVIEDTVVLERFFQAWRNAFSAYAQTVRKYLGANNAEEWSTKGSAIIDDIERTVRKNYHLQETREKAEVDISKREMARDEIINMIAEFCSATSAYEKEKLSRALLSGSEVPETVNSFDQLGILIARTIGMQVISHVTPGPSDDDLGRARSIFDQTAKLEELLQNIHCTLMGKRWSCPIGTSIVKDYLRFTVDDLHKMKIPSQEILTRTGKIWGNSKNALLLPFRENCTQQIVGIAQKFLDDLMKRAQLSLEDYAPKKLKSHLQYTMFVQIIYSGGDILMTIAEHQKMPEHAYRALVDRYIATCTKIENELQKYIDEKKRLPLSRLAEAKKSTSPLIGQVKSDEKHEDERTEQVPSDLQQKLDEMHVRPERRWQFLQAWLYGAMKECYEVAVVKADSLLEVEDFEANATAGVKNLEAFSAELIDRMKTLKGKNEDDAPSFDQLIDLIDVAVKDLGADDAGGQGWLRTAKGGLREAVWNSYHQNLAHAQLITLHDALANVYKQLGIAQEKHGTEPFDGQQLFFSHEEVTMQNEIAKRVSETKLPPHGLQYACAEWGWSSDEIASHLETYLQSLIILDTGKILQERAERLRSEDFITQREKILTTTTNLCAAIGPVVAEYCSSVPAPDQTLEGLRTHVSKISITGENLDAAVATEFLGSALKRISNHTSAIDLFLEHGPPSAAVDIATFIGEQFDAVAREKTAIELQTAHINRQHFMQNYVGRCSVLVSEAMVASLKKQFGTGTAMGGKAPAVITSLNRELFDMSQLDGITAIAETVAAETSSMHDFVAKPDGPILNDGNLLNSIVERLPEPLKQFLMDTPIPTSSSRSQGNPIPIDIRKTVSERIFPVADSPPTDHEKRVIEDALVQKVGPEGLKDLTPGKLKSPESLHGGVAEMLATIVNDRCYGGQQVRTPEIVLAIAEPVLVKVRRSLKNVQGKEREGNDSGLRTSQQGPTVEGILGQKLFKLQEQIAVLQKKAASPGAEQSDALETLELMMNVLTVLDDLAKHPERAAEKDLPPSHHE